MKKEVSNTQRLVTLAFLIALEIVLTRFASINVSILRIGFGFLPIAIAAMLYGPVWAGLAYAVGDVIGAFLFPTGAFFPGFTLSAFLTGLIYGLVLYKHEVTWKRAILACSIVMIGVNLCLNTFWLTFIVGKGYMALLPPRIIKELIAIPICAVLIKAMDASVIKAVKKDR